MKQWIPLCALVRDQSKPNEEIFDGSIFSSFFSFWSSFFASKRFQLLSTLVDRGVGARRSIAQSTDLRWRRRRPGRDTEAGAGRHGDRPSFQAFDWSPPSVRVVAERTVDRDCRRRAGVDDSSNRNGNRHPHWFLSDHVTGTPSSQTKEKEKQPPPPGKSTSFEMCKCFFFSRFCRLETFRELAELISCSFFIVKETSVFIVVT